MIGYILAVLTAAIGIFIVMTTDEEKQGSYYMKFAYFLSGLCFVVAVLMIFFTNVKVTSITEVYDNNPSEFEYYIEDDRDYPEDDVVLMRKSDSSAVARIGYEDGVYYLTPANTEL